MDSKSEFVRTTAANYLAMKRDATVEHVRAAVTRAIEFAGIDPKEIDIDGVCRDIEANMVIYMPPSLALDAKGTDHEEWLNDGLSFAKAGRQPTEWNFWRRYKRYLADVKNRPPAVLSELDRSTTDALKRLEDPTRPGAWDRRGMVVGSVQSGKTSHFTGLICKAADAGYKLIVVLSGMHDNLRSQTQLRLDEEFLGWESDKSYAYSASVVRIGVGQLYAEKPVIAHTLTNSSPKGDFSVQVAAQAGVTPGNDPVLFVVKKHVSILKNLNSWVRTLQQFDAASDKVRNLPILVIDDECDQASVNTKPLDTENEDYNLTETNKQIRRLLRGFDKAAYVGYTATPFACIFIHDANPHKEFGDDLFPRDFIISLKPPTNYQGPPEIFGFDADPRRGVAARERSPTVFEVSDYESHIPDGHKKEDRITTLPPSLYKAMRRFLLASAARAARGHSKAHNSMLIHVTRYQWTQGDVASLVNQELESLQRRLDYNDGRPGDPNAPLLRELRTLWEFEFVPTSRKLRPNEEPESWDTIVHHLADSTRKMKVRTINGSSKEVLDYKAAKDGLNVIAIGGDKLSRGLTLDGLTISYYLRATDMYDTLMQMGRWFGYRPGYEDLCRIHTTPILIEYYRWIALATEELRDDFDVMHRNDATPKEFGLRVRSHPDGDLLVTAMNKQRASVEITPTFASRLAQALVYHKDPTVWRGNSRAAEDLIARLGKPDETKQAWLWRDVNASEVTSFLSLYTAHPDNPRANPLFLRDYITDELDRGGLQKWNVALIRNGTFASVHFAGLEVKPVKRKPARNLPDRISLDGLLSPDDEALDLSTDDAGKAMSITLAEWEAEQANPAIKKKRNKPEIPTGSAIRLVRNDTGRPLLMIYPIEAAGSEWTTSGERPVPPNSALPIGFAVSFPDSVEPELRPRKYRANTVYAKEYQ